MSEEERGPVLARYQGSAADRRTLATVRGGAAVIALGGALLLLLGRLTIPVFLLALLGLLMSVVWLRQAARLLREARTVKPASLVVHRAGIAIEEPTRRVWVPFAELARVDVDEERVDIVLTRTAGEPLRIEPQYPGVDIYELVRTLDDALQVTRIEGGRAVDDA